MIPADFDYVAPDSLEGVLRALAEGGEDAKPLGVTYIDMPLTPMRVWQAIQDAGGAPTTPPPATSDGGAA